MDPRQLREIVENAANAAVQEHADRLRTAVVERVLAELSRVIGSGEARDLNASMSAIQEKSSQVDVLTALLDGVAKFSVRCGLLILKGTLANGWNARGFNVEAFRRAQLDASRGLLERAIRTRALSRGTAPDLDSSFAAQFGSPSDNNVIALPLIIRERVAALLIADGGPRGKDGLNVDAVELLVRSTSVWLEVLALRKGAPAEPQNAPTATAAHASERIQSTDTGQPSHASAANSWSGSQGSAAQTGGSYAPTASGSDSSRYASQVSTLPEADEIHNKARRFAKLLVEEIKLYNQVKVSEGRQNRDLYARLREDIDKSRAAYAKRFAAAVPERDYFRSELVRILANDDASLMGPDFGD